ncbi:MAG: sec-independent translocase [Frankiaceae bacterium]
MFNNLGWGEIAFLVVLALFIFGPERLPKVAADAGRMLRQVRAMAQNATADIKAEMGPEMADLDLSGLTPRKFVEKHLFSDDEDPVSDFRQPTRPLRPGETPPYDPDAT